MRHDIEIAFVDRLTELQVCNWDRQPLCLLRLLLFITLKLWHSSSNLLWQMNWLFLFDRFSQFDVYRHSACERSDKSLHRTRVRSLLIRECLLGVIRLLLHMFKQRVLYNGWVVHRRPSYIIMITLYLWESCGCASRETRLLVYFYSSFPALCRDRSGSFSTNDHVPLLSVSRGLPS